MFKVYLNYNAKENWAVRLQMSGENKINEIQRYKIG